MPDGSEMHPKRPFTTTDLRVAMAQMVVLQALFSLDSDDDDGISDLAAQQHIEITDRIIDRYMPLFEGLFSRDDVLNRIMHVSLDDAKHAVATLAFHGVAAVMPVGSE